MGVFPHFHPLGLGEVGALVAASMAPVTHGSNPEVMGLDGSALPISKLVWVGSDHRTVLDPTDLAGGLPQQLQQPFIAVDHRITYFMGLSLIVEILPSALNSFKTRSTLDSEKM
jgi:hypothetical protein